MFLLNRLFGHFQNRNTPDPSHNLYNISDIIILLGQYHYANIMSVCEHYDAHHNVRNAHVLSSGNEDIMVYGK